MSGLVKGNFRVMVAPPNAPHPDGIGDLLDTAEGETKWDDRAPWFTAGASRVGLAHNGLGGLVGPDEREDSRGHFVATQFVAEDTRYQRLGMAMGRQVRVAFLREVDGDIECFYFPLATVQPFAVPKGMGESGSIPMRFDVGPHGFRRLTHEQGGQA